MNRPGIRSSLSLAVLVLSAFVAVPTLAQPAPGPRTFSPQLPQLQSGRCILRVLIRLDLTLGMEKTASATLRVFSENGPPIVPLLRPSAATTSNDVTTLTFIRQDDCSTPIRAVVNATCVEEGKIGSDWTIAARSAEHTFPSRTRYGVLSEVTIPGAC